MGCCCSEPGVPGVPNQVPDPPPLCNIRMEPFGYDFIKFVVNSVAGGGPDLDAANNAAWAAFGAKNFVRSSCVGSPQFSAGGVIISPKNPSGSTAVAYKHVTQVVTIPLFHTFGGTLYSMKELYGVIAGEIVSQSYRRIFRGTSLSAVWPYNTGGNNYSRIWTDYEFFWGLSDSSNFRLTGSGAWILEQAAFETDGGKALAPNSLGTLTLDETNPIGAYNYYRDVMDVTPVLDQKGDEFLVLYLESAVLPAKQTFSITEDSPLDGIGNGLPPFIDEGFGGSHLQGTSNSPGLNCTSFYFRNFEYGIVFIWPCIITLTLRINIKQNNGSSIVEEDRISDAEYLSGTNLTKRFRLQDDTLGTASNIVEIFTADGSFTVPAGVTSLLVEITGGGGGGGGGDGDINANAGGGGGGSFLRKDLTATPGEVLPFTVGAGGAGSAPNGNGAAGGDTQFNGQFTLVAGGGGGTTGVSTGGAGGVFTPIGLSFGRDGGDGGNGQGIADAGGGGGGAGSLSGTGGAGGDGSGTTGGAGGTGDGVGGAGGDTGMPGVGGTAPGGGGGGGALDVQGGDGAGGQVKITYAGVSDTVSRQCDVYLTENAGVYTLNFDYHREVLGTNDPDYYLEPITPFQLTVGEGTAVASVSDLEGLLNTFFHNGVDNVDTVKGTEDAIVEITVEKVNISTALP